MDINNTIIFGDSEYVLKDIDDKVHLCVTSPPYFNMRGEMDYGGYDNYLQKMYDVFKGVYRVLEHRRIVAVNICDYIDDGTKYPVAFDLHYILDKEIGFTYIDSIIWVKPAGVGNRAGNVIKRPYPMYFTPDNRYEQILIFSRGKKSDYEHIYQEESRIDIERFRPFLGDVWEFSPHARNEKNTDVHNSAYPKILPELITRFYSYIGENVLDPFFGHGTTMRATSSIGRSCIGIEMFKSRERSIKKNVRYGQQSILNSTNWNTIYHDSAKDNFNSNVQ